MFNNIYWAGGSAASTSSRRLSHKVLTLHCIKGVASESTFKSLFPDVLFVSMTMAVSSHQRARDPACRAEVCRPSIYFKLRDDLSHQNHRHAQGKVLSVEGPSTVSSGDLSKADPVGAVVSDILVSAIGLRPSPAPATRSYPRECWRSTGTLGGRWAETQSIIASSI
ncbi:hypothetical protein EVAR_97962_1 [Eumeta japonica]|uniref:Uncharacterized protein n=1 Tax=Eumeta variegata TaxID=151549 RepID=A0A4C1XFB9_EUMVA|nr:hypothetical protein EVAR_97962_1 [Eumeta japonica]